MTETQQVPVETIWWCAACDSEVPDRFVSYEETHDGCGNVVVIVPAIEPRYDLLEAANRLCALSADLAHQGDEERAYAAADIAAEVRVHAEATEPSEVERLAVEIADEAALATILCECSWNDLDGVLWLDTGYAAEHGVSVDAEIKYLDLRGLLEHHPDHPEWVQVKEQKP